MGRPKMYHGPQKEVAIKVPLAVYDKIQELAASEDRSLAYVIRMALIAEFGK